MLWLNTKINNLVKTINPKDIAFLLASGLEINKAKRSRQKAQVALDCLSSHVSFKNYFFEFYFRDFSHKLRCVALGGFSNDLKSPYVGRSVDSNSSVVYKVFHTKKAYFDINLDKEHGRRGELVKKLGVKASFLLPVENFGIIVVDKNDTDKFDDYELVLLKHFIDEVVSPSLDLAFDNEKNFGASIRDSLTRLYNHGYFMFQLDNLIENARRLNIPISLVMIDIDYFKNYNDMHGHPKGDKVLVNVANLLRHNTRKGDVVARYGGEEFAILLFNANAGVAAMKAEQFRKAVQNFYFEYEKMQPNKDLTISLGVASFPLHTKEGADLLIKADKALYNSKNKGKNRVSVYGNY